MLAHLIPPIQRPCLSSVPEAALGVRMRPWKVETGSLPCSWSQRPRDRNQRVCLPQFVRCGWQFRNFILVFGCGGHSHTGDEHGCDMGKLTKRGWRFICRRSPSVVLLWPSSAAIAKDPCPSCPCVRALVQNQPRASL